jgi:outer membrane protein insertion porin family
VFKLSPPLSRGGHLVGVAVIALVVGFPIGLHGVVLAAEAAETDAQASQSALAEAKPKTPEKRTEVPEEGRLVKEILIEGASLVSEESVRNSLRTKVGERYREADVQEDVRTLVQTGKFENVYATRQLDGDQVVVTFTVVEKPEVESVEFYGNKKFSAKDLLEDVDLGPGSPMDRFAVNRGRDNIEQRYKDAGYSYAKVAVDEELIKNERRVVYTIVEGPRVRVRKILFEGNENFSDRRLKREINTKTYIWLFRTGELDQERLERDVADLAKFYRNEGFLDAKVSYRIETSEDLRDLTLIFVIDEGIRYYVESIKVEGNRAFDNDAILTPLKIQPGTAYINEWIKSDVEYLEAEYGRSGYIYANVKPQWVYSETTPGQIHLTLKIDEGNQFRVGRIVVRGNERTKDKVVRRNLRFYPEELYDTTKTKVAEQRLRETTLFSEASVTPVGDEEGVRDALVRVAETETTVFLLGVGVTSNSGVVGNLSIENRNFDLFDWPRSTGEFFRGKSFKGAGQILRFQVEPGTELNRLRLDFREPYLLDQPVSFGQGFYLYSRGREGYDERRVGTQTSFGHRFQRGILRGWAGEVALRIEGVKISGADFRDAQDIQDDEGSHFLTSVKGTLVRDTTDSRLMPSRGSRFVVSYEQFGALGGEYSFGKLTASHAWYRTLHEDVLDRKHILVLHGKAGQIFGDAPVFERFYGGGLGSIRGFEYRGVSPRQGFDDDPVGGDFMLVCGAEYSFPIYGKILRGVTFLDMGTVEDDFGISSWRASLGVGARVVVEWLGPVPLAFDFSVPISKDSEDDTQVFQFSIGVTF